MDQENCQLAASLVSRTYISQGAQALQQRRKLIKALLSQRRLPAEGWDDATIELFIQDVALMDSNNFPSNVGVGEREARVASELVARRHWRLAHGIGRSGDVSAEQPKAAGSSLLVKLTALLAADALEIAGLKEMGPVLVLPAATGMAITTTLLALRSMRPATARYVLWPRVDQKTCLKSITAAGFEVVPIPMLRQSGADELTTDLAAIQHQLDRLGADQVACIVTTTSCFAPRAADDVVGVGKLCQAVGVPHIINNAYGVQASALCAAITSAWRKGRVDAVIQSTDKNFMVPVGGAIIAARKGHTQLVERVNSLYPGRASMSPLLDLLITLLHWGASGWRQVLKQRGDIYGYALQRLQDLAAEVGERVLSTPGNPISLALTLDSLTSSVAEAGRAQQGQPAANGATVAAAAAVAAASPALATAAAVEAAGPNGTAGGGAAAPAFSTPAHVAALPATLLGSMLFKRCVSGTRVVARGKRQTVGGVSFEGYGAHADDYPHDYLTVAAAVGTTHSDIDGFVERARQCFAEFKRRQQQGQQGQDQQR